MIRHKKDNTQLFFEIIIDELYDKYYQNGLSFVDCSLLAVIDIFDINILAIFSSEFKGIVKILPEIN